MQPNERTQENFHMAAPKVIPWSVTKALHISTTSDIFVSTAKQPIDEKFHWNLPWVKEISLFDGRHVHI